MKIFAILHRKKKVFGGLVLPFQVNTFHEPCMKHTICIGNFVLKTVDEKNNEKINERSFRCF